jgi:hypothetical protein
MWRARSLLVVVCALAARAAAADPAPPLVLVAPDVPSSRAATLAPTLLERGFEPAQPAPEAQPASEAVLAAARPFYERMEFQRAVKQLAEAEVALLGDSLATPARVRALADVEVWRGACLWLERDHAGALERWALAVRLQPRAKPDPIFPPELAKAFARRPREAKPVPIAVRVAPALARLWIDGRLVAGPPMATPGLHYIVVERADFVPVAQILRVTRSGAQIAVSLQKPARPADALRQVVERLRAGPLATEEGIGVSDALGRALWIVSSSGEGWRADRYAARDAARSLGHVEAPTAESLSEAMAATEGHKPAVAVAPSPALPVAIAAPPPPPAPLALAASAPPKPPLWKRGWFWGIVATSALIVAGVATGAALAADAPQKYDARIR